MRISHFFDGDFNQEDIFSSELFEQDLDNFQEEEEQEEFFFDDQSENDLIEIEIDSEQEIEDHSSFQETMNRNNSIYYSSKKIFVFCDSEFQGDTFISLQVHYCFYLNNEFFSGSYIVFNQDFQLFCEERIWDSFSFKGNNIEVMYSVFDERTNVFLDTLTIQLKNQGFFENFEMNSVEVYLYFYFSWKDLRACFGFENLREFLVPSKPSKKEKNGGKIF